MSATILKFPDLESDVLDDLRRLCDSEPGEATVHILPGDHAAQKAHEMIALGYDVSLHCHGDEWRLTAYPQTNANVVKMPRRHHQYVGAVPTRPADPDGDGPKPAA